MKQWKYAFILALVGLILLAAAMILPLYYQNHNIQFYNPIYETEESIETDYKYKLTEVDIEETYGNHSSTITIDYSSSLFPFNTLEIIFIQIFYMAILAIIMSILFIICIIVAGITKGRLVKLGLVFGIIAFITTLAIPSDLFVEVPMAFKEYWNESDLQESERPDYTKSFFGSDSDADEYSKWEYKWGGAIGWYLSIMALICIFCSVVLLRFYRKALRHEELVYGWRKEDDYDLKPEPEAPEPTIYEAEVVEAVIRTIECPKCKEKFKIRDTGRPLSIECPHCGVCGELK